MELITKGKQRTARGMEKAKKLSLTKLTMLVSGRTTINMVRENRHTLTEFTKERFNMMKGMAKE